MKIGRFMRQKINFFKLYWQSIDVYQQSQDIAYFQYSVKEETLYILSSSCLIFSFFLEELKEDGEVLFKNILLGMEKDHKRQVRLKENWYLIEFHYFYKRGKLDRVKGLFIDIQDFKENEQYLLEVSKKDGLTNLYNKVTVEKIIKEKIETLKQGVLFMGDIDSFKKLNDHLGHLEGDEILKRFAKQLNEVFSCGIIGRVGGDEFVVYTENMEDKDIIDNISLLFDKVLNQYNKIPFSISIGIVKYNGCDSYREFYNKADQAMYKAKKQKQKFYIYE